MCLLSKATAHKFVKVTKSAHFPLNCTRFETSFAMSQKPEHCTKKILAS